LSNYFNQLATGGGITSVKRWGKMELTAKEALSNAAIPTKSCEKALVYHK
jgi:hypothetical protein